MSFATDKLAVLNALKSRNCNLAIRFESEIRTYTDMLFRFNERHKEFDCDPDYLDAILGAMDDAALVAMGVQNGKTGALTNPKIVNGGTVSVTINSGGEIPFLYICGGATVSLITITGNTHVRYLEVLGGSQVTKIDVTQGSRIGELQVSKCTSPVLASKVTHLTRQSLVEDISIDDPGTGFDGLECPTFSTTNSCNEEVSNVVISFTSQNAAGVTWTNPTNSAGRKVSWRKKGETEWQGTIPALATASYIGFVGWGTEIEVWIQNRCTATSDFSPGVIVSATSNPFVTPAP